MLIKDPIYGNFKVDEEVICQLLNSDEMQRLKGIDVAGNANYFYPGTWHSRYEHSVGVFLLLRRFRASLEEQIAGLLHDISHSAFSHGIDYILKKGDEKTQNYQDSIHEEYIKNSSVNKILEGNGYDIDKILDESNFLLKEREIPDICADRLDYSLRDSYYCLKIDRKKINRILSNLVILKDYWVFKEEKIAYEYAKIFYKLNKTNLSSLVSGVMFLSIGRYIGYALEEGYIDLKDLYKTDEEVLRKVKAHHKSDIKLRRLYKYFQNKIEYSLGDKNDGEEVFCKSRLVDPLVKQDGQVVRLSKINKQWANIFEGEMKPKHYFVKFKS